MFKTLNKFDNVDSRISTSGFAATATETAVFDVIFGRTAQQSVLDGTNGLSSSKPCAYCRTACTVRIETGSSFSHDY